MAADFFVVKFFWFVAFVFFGFAVSAAISARKAPSARSLSGSLIKGYFGLLFGTFLYAWISALIIGINKVELGHITSGELPGLIPAWSLYWFVIFAPFALVIFTITGLPLFLVLRKLKIASIFLMLLGVVAASILAGAYLYINSQDNWCQTSQLHCFVSNAWGVALPAFFATLFFCVCVPLPLFRPNGKPN